jgi:beta-lactamase regulating signal transducer with metallopeptidase domain
MNPNLLLGIVAAFASFVLKTTLAFGVGLALSWIADSPNRRFTIWLAFLYGAAAYWLWTVNGFLGSGELPGNVFRSSVQPIASAAGALQVPSSWAIPLGIALRVIGAAYLLALTYVLLTHIKKQRQLKWVLRFTTKPSAEIETAFKSIAERLHVGRSTLRVLSGISSPATFGWIRPMILLPDGCLQRDPSELYDILRHELHHVRRWDFVWNGFAVLCRALLFFHPAAWYAVRRMQFNRELACDLAVVSDSPERRAKYAECLVHFARLNSSQDPNAWGIDFAASSEHLKARVQSILVEANRPSCWSFGLRSAFGLILLAGFVCVAPSLAVLLSFAHQQISQPLTPMIAPFRAQSGTKVRTKNARLSTSSTPTSTDAVVGNVSHSEAAQPIETLPADHEIQGPSSTQNGSGPQLVRGRSPSSGNSVAPESTAAKQQTTVLIDDEDTDASGQVSKNGARDKWQAVQQAATAAASIYRRLGVVDRH